MRFGAHSWLLETRYPLRDAIRRAREIGYDAYEPDIGNFAGTGLGLRVLPDRLQAAQREEIRAASADAGMPICSLCLGALWHYPPAGTDEVLRARGVRIVRAAIPLARDLGADVPFDRVMAALGSIGYDGYLVAEVPTIGRDADLVARENLEALRALTREEGTAP